MVKSSFSSSEVQYIENNWGIKPIIAIAKNLNRSVNSILSKKNHLQLGPFLDNGTYITINQFFEAIGRKAGTSYTLEAWIKKGFPVKNKTVLNNSFKVIYLDDFWIWAKEYHMHIDFSKFKANALGKEPKWVKTQRKADIAFSKYKVTPWTREEDGQLRGLLKLYKYTYRELSTQILRTEGAIKRRIRDLGIKDWPLREAPNSIWSKEEIDIVVDMYNKGYKNDVIKEYINKSAQSIGGKVERLIKDGFLIKHK